MIINNPNVAKFMWGNENNVLFNIDKISKKFQNKKIEYSICPIKHGIGMILFTRETWKKMKMFEVINGKNMGVDEQHLCNYCMSNSKVIIVCENLLVGHFSYGPQTEEMKVYYKKRCNK